MSSVGREVTTIDVLAARPLVAAREIRHAETVMDLCVAGGLVATIDFAGHWGVWRAADLARVAGGKLPGRVGRRIAMAPDGRRLAVLTGAEGIDHNWRADIVDVASGEFVGFGGTDYRGLAWTDAGLFALGPLGYRIHDATGRELVDGHHAPEPGSAWMGYAPTRDGSRIYYMHHDQLAGVAVADGRVLPAPDITPFARPSGHVAWAFPNLAVSEDGEVLALGFCDEVLLWRLSDGELVARIVPRGEQIVGARVRFAGGALVACFSHVFAGPSGDRGQRKTIATLGLASGRVTSLVSTARHFHGGKGGADGSLLVAHGSALSLVT